MPSKRIIAAVFFCLAGPCLAQTGAPAPIFLRPALFQAPPGPTISLEVESVETLQIRAVPWPEAIRWLFVRSPGFQENRSQDDAPHPAPGERTVSILLEHPGVTVIGLDLPPRTVQWPADRLAAIQGAAIQIAAPAADASPDAQVPVEAPATIPVRLVQTAKAVLTVGDADAGTVGTGKTGQAVEIRPFMDPAVAPVGSDMILRAYIDGDTVKNATITATNVAAGKVEKVQLGPGGPGSFHVSAPGLWRLEFTLARPLKDNPDAKWTVYSTTLTFQTSDAPAPAAAPAPVPAEEGAVNP